MNASSSLRRRPARHRRQGRSRRRRSGAALGRARALPLGDVMLIALLLLVGAFYTWTALTSSDFSWAADQRDPLNLQADGFLNGHTYLPVRPEAELLRLARDHEPVISSGSSLTHDLSLHDGRLYSYWAPVAVVLVFLPYRLLGQGDLPPAIAGLIFALVALLGVAALVRFIARRFFPAAPAWATPALVGGIAVGSLLAFLLRRPGAYEVALLAGACFLVLGLLALAHGLLGGRPRPCPLGLASLCLGLAVGCRPPLGLAALLLGVAGVAVWRTSEGEERRRSLLALSLPWLACVAALAAFNVVRFGSPAEFGFTYQLSGYDQSRSLRAAYLLPGLWHYVLAAPLPRVQFPYLWLNPTRSDPFQPSYFVGYERTAGLLPLAPFLLVLLAARAALAGRAAALRGAVAAVAALALVLLVFLSAFFWGTIQRYETEFGLLFLLAAGAVWLGLLTAPRTAVRRLGAAAGGLLLLWTAAAGAAISLGGEDGSFRLQHASTYDALRRFFGPLPTAVAGLVGHPIPAAIDGDAAVSPQRYDQLGVQGYTYEIGDTPRTLQVVSPDRRQSWLRARLRRGPAIPPNQRLALRATSAGGYAAVRPVDGRIQRLPLRLHRGLNTITLTLLHDRPLPQADPAKLAEIRAEYIELAG